MAGELYMGGVGVARGYLNRPDLTAARFIPNPFGSGRLYQTGDLVRYWPDGAIEFLGRTDFQVKVRGFRIELGEIEAVLNQHPQVQQAIVVARDQGTGKRLVAYMVGAADLATLRAHLAAHLPDYMVPAAFVVLDTVPLTPNGKVDRKALPAPNADSLIRETYRAPRTPTEQTLTSIWQQVLEVDRVGIDDNFFALGGHSLLAVQILHAIQQATGQSIPFTSLLQHATIATLSGLLEGETALPPVRALVPIRSTGTRPPLFLVHPIGGHVFCYEPLARRLDRDQPVYGLQAVGLHGEHPVLETIEAMATHYLAELRMVQPHGPYVLGGWSFGGIVAFEMAHQLMAQGDVVARLVLIDTVLPDARHPVPTDMTVLLRRFLADLWGQAPTGARSDDGQALVTDPATLPDAVLEDPAVAPLLPSGTTAAQRQCWWRVFRANMRARAAYWPRAYQGMVRLLTAANREDSAVEAWQELAADLEWVPLTGNHYTIMQEPHVQGVAEQVGRALAAPVSRDVHATV